MRAGHVKEIFPLTFPATLGRDVSGTVEEAGNVTQFKRGDEVYALVSGGYPERFAQDALGHNSAAVHRAYARKAKVIVPSLEDYEKASRNGAAIKCLPAAKSL